MCEGFGGLDDVPFPRCLRSALNQVQLCGPEILGDWRIHRLTYRQPTVMVSIVLDRVLHLFPGLHFPPHALSQACAKVHVQTSWHDMIVGPFHLDSSKCTTPQHRTQATDRLCAATCSNDLNSFPGTSQLPRHEPALHHQISVIPVNQRHRKNLPPVPE